MSTAHRTCLCNLVVLTLFGLHCCHEVLAEIILPLDGVQTIRPKELEYFRRTRIISAEDVELDALLADENLTVALLAKWEIACRGQEGGLDPVRWQIDVREFTSIIKSRIGIRTPLWWQVTVASEDGLSKREHRCSPPKVNSPMERSVCYYHLSKDIKASSANNRTTFKDGAHSITIDAPTPTVFPAMQVAIVRLQEENLFVAFATFSGIQFELQRFNLDGKEEWQNRVWGAGDLVTHQTGYCYHNAEIVVSDETVCIFGMHRSGVYIEGFRRTDGEPIFRFASKYSGAMP